MKPNKLIMSAFCPYPSEVEIDFEAFGGGGLFLITGETGAGKTTVFDGISFALYGDVSGENRSTDMLRSDFAKPETPTFVKFNFEHKGLFYEIKRNPKYNRLAKRGGGLTLQNAEAELSMPNGRIVTGSKEVTEEVIKLLGVDHKQFKQISMIAQGEFLKLLIADSKERGEIFRKVFGTDIYEKIQGELKQKANGLKSRLETMHNSILQYYDGIMINTDHEAYEQFVNDKKSVFSITKVLDLLRALIQEDQENKAETDRIGKAVGDQIQQKTVEITVAEQMNGLIVKLEEERQHLDRLLKNRKAMEDSKVELDFCKKALYQVRPIQITYKNLENQLKDIDENILKQKKIIENNTPLWDAKALELKYQLEEEPLREKLVLEIKKIEESLLSYEVFDLKKAELKSLEAHKKTLDASISSHAQKLDKSKIRLIAIIAALEPLNNCASEKVQMENDKEKLLQQQKNNLLLKQNLRECMALRQKLETMKEAFISIDKTYSQVLQKYNQDEQRFYAEQAGILAQRLEAGTPCPVCGALEHPNKAVMTVETLSQKQLKEEKDKLETLQSKWHTSSQQCNGLKVEMETKDRQLVNEVANLLKIQVTGYSELEEQLEQHAAATDGQLNVIKQQLNSVEEKLQQKVSLEKEQNDLHIQKEQDELKLNQEKDALATLEIKRSALTTEMLGLKNSLAFSDKQEAEKTLNIKKNNLTEMKNKLSETQEAYQVLSNMIQEAKAIEENSTNQRLRLTEVLVTEKDKYEQILKACGFLTEDDYFQRLVSEETLVNMEQELNQYYIDVEKANTTINQLELQTKDKKRVDLDILHEEDQALKNQQLKLNQSAQNLEHIIKTNQRVLKLLEESNRERDKLEAEYIEMKMLSDTANGDLSRKQKLAFEQYVQGVYFEKVLIEANKRLGKMTHHRYELIHKHETSNNQSKSGLEIDVKDNWTCKQRSVKSLSGGESFKASLALALGLSDVVQSFSGGIQLDAMFIDEGFGALDSESLDKAIEILIELTEGDRLVGIISHVDELKERIDRKIVISKDRQGSTITLEA